MEPEIPPHPASAKVVDFNDWATDSTSSMKISLVQPQKGDEDSSDPVTSISFNPEFTYPIFGDYEKIFGYKDLSINLKYASGSLQPYLDVQYSSKYIGSHAIDNVTEILNEYLPEKYLTNYDKFIDSVKADNEKFKPFGEKIHQYSRESKNGLDHFEIYKTSFSNQKFREYHSRMKMFVLLFIEGGSFIEDDDEKWEIYSTFKKEKSHYHFVGYSTVYPFYYWPENTRVRISQFLVLPPYKMRGHGSELYQTLYQIFKSRNDISEITVEDSNEEFADMRDKNDIRYMLEHGGLQGLKAPVSSEKFNTLQQEYKFTDRQLHRCIEIYLLSNVNKMNEHDYKTYRLQVKHRIYVSNYDVVQSLHKEYRKEKLHETYLSLEDEYHRILELI